MQLLTIDDGALGAAGVLLRNGDVLNLCRAARGHGLEAWVPRSVQGLLAGGVEGLDVVKRIVDRVERLDADARQALQADGVIAAGPRLLAPVPKPALVLAAGLSYRSHNAEMAGSKAAAHPTGFLKAPSSIAAPGAVLRIPRQAQDFVDFEGELTCVFGRRCHNVTAAEAGHYIGGYTIANDVSARDWVQAVFQAQDPWEARQTWDVNLMGKQFAGFTPVGPVVTTADEIRDPAALSLTTRLNGVVMQAAPVSDLIFNVFELISYFSRWYTFEPGDLLLTGTPSGVGVGRKPPVFMHPGDTVEVEIDKIGILRTPIMAPPN